MKRPFLVALAITIPLGLLVAARETNSWRPKVLGEVRGRNPKLTISPDGRWLLTQSDSMGGESDWLWDLNARRRVRTLPPGRLIMISPDSRILAVVSHEDDVRTSRFDPSPVKVQLFDLEGGRLKRVLRDPQPPLDSGIADIAFSLDGKELVWVTPRSFCRFNASTGKLINHTKFQSRFSSLSPDTKQILRDFDGHIEIRNLKNLSAESGLILPRSRQGVAGWSPDGKIVWQRLPFNHGFRLWQAQTGKHIHDWQTSNGASNLHFTPDSKHFFHAKGDRLELRDVFTGKTTKTLPGPRAEPFQIAPDGSFAISVEGGKLLRWRLK